ncbi:hypothetical protein [Acidithiobacillus albertensis]|nr:hypothetical protein [Acidithiobacillus albertensis]
MLVSAPPTAAVISSASSTVLQAREIRRILIRLHYLPLIPEDYGSSSD